MRNLGKVISETTKLPVRVAGDPLCCVALGNGKVLDNLDYFAHVLFKQDYNVFESSLLIWFDGNM